MTSMQKAIPTQRELGLTTQQLTRLTSLVQKSPPKSCCPSWAFPNNALNCRSLRSLGSQKLHFWMPVSLFVRHRMTCDLGTHLL
ncbi:hypothetical protein CUN63_00960 [Pseudomonas sp. ACM7]|nr:hypothetical protein CUN63_00960 [Pseudomonas sp. ACM7]